MRIVSTISTHLIAGVAAWLQHFRVVTLTVEFLVQHAISEIDQEFVACRTFEAARVKVNLKIITTFLFHCRMDMKVIHPPHR